MVPTSHTIMAAYLASIHFHDRREHVKNNAKGNAHHRENRDHLRAGHVDAIVLHSMGFDWGSSIPLYDRVKAHFAVLRTGDILYLHEYTDYLMAAHDFNTRGISIEFAGNPPSERGKAHQQEKFGLHIPTREQIASGRALVRLLCAMLPIAHIFGHKQSCDKICPGPHVWYNVGRWAKRELGLSDGGAGYSTSNAYCTGSPIPASWDDDQFDLMSLPGPANK